jgi:antitoxin ParD1/3/4
MLCASFEGHSMSVRQIRLPPEQDAFLDQMLESGDYLNASEAVGDALRELRRRRELEGLRLERLRVAVQQGVAALDRGAFTEVADEALDAYLDELAVSPLD